ncbi:arsenate reductase family protein [Paenibacillus cremeus]|uniref:Arsenate reductase family protein n=1 Tax=Paenibacillus cremeus TaxID=2163881 RepID=A0A559K6B7_9BACL|nr:arsenate reductase family protein [Paenibacillus cremeus]TVY07685.1 arsenate reductase family protein [Paenibacillus cremeus]
MNGKRVTMYWYPQCGTCRNALKSLKEQGVEVETIHLFETPPSAAHLKELIAQSGLEIKKWFNTSGEVYKEMKLKDQLPGMSAENMIELLASNGRLIKRPVVTDGQQVTVGFKPETYAEVWGSTNN